MLRLFIRTTILAWASITILTGSAKAQDPGQTNAALIATLKTPHRIQTVALSPDGKLVAAGYGFVDEGGITIWNVADRSVVVSLLQKESAEDGIERVAFSEDGKLFAAASYHGTVILWTVGSWQNHKTLFAGHGNTTDLSFSPDSKKLAYSSDKAAILYDLQSGNTTVIATGKDRGKDFYGISFSPDGQSVIVCGSQAIQVWDIATREVTKSWKPDGPGFFGRLSPDGTHVIAGGGAVYGDKLVEIWNFPGGQKLKELKDFKNGLFSLAISHSGKLFALGGGTFGSPASMSLWDFNSDHELGFAAYGDFPIQGLAFSPDDKVLAAASESGFVLLYDVDRLRGPQIEKQSKPLCGEIRIEGNKAFIEPLSKVAGIMSDKFVLPWRLEISNADSVTGLAGLPVVLQDWSLENGAGAERARVSQVKSLLPRNVSRDAKSNYVIYGYVQNPGWDKGYAVKIFADGSFVAANNSGECRAYGNLNQLTIDFQTVKKRLTDSGLLSIPKNPLTIGADHFGTAFMELTVNGAPELRSDADSFDLLISGKPSKKRELFNHVYEKENKFVESLLHAGTRLPPN